MTKIIYVDFKNKMVVGRETVAHDNDISKAAPVKTEKTPFIDETMESILKELEIEYGREPKK